MGRDQAVGVSMLLRKDANAWLYGSCYDQRCLSVSCLQCEEYYRARVISPVLYLSQAAGHLEASIVCSRS